jgi:tetratricopeptide (TPR) repeat protein
LAAALASLALCGPLGALSLGCATAGANGASARARPVPDEQFAASVASLLREREPSPSRGALLTAVVQRQFAHAGERLAARQRERGLAGVYGALFLVRRGELTPAMVRGPGERALELASEAVAATGDEGKTLALYNLRRAALAAGDRSGAELQTHAAAIKQWSDAFVTKPGVGPHEIAGYRARAAVGRALLEPTDAALRDAKAAVDAWGEGGMMFQTPGQLAMRGERAPMRATRREDAIEGYRAYASAGLTLASIYLRHGDARGALAAIGGSRVEAITPPALVDRLRAAAEGDGAPAWRALLEVFAHALQNVDEVGVDRDLLRAAAFGVAVEAYRRDRSSPEVGTELASSLVALGMPEAAPLVLVDALRANPDPELASAVFETLGRVMWREVEGDDPASAHRVFRAAEPLLALADAGALRGRVRPSPNALRLLAARVEARAGQLGEARALLGRLVRAEPSAPALLLAAEVERQLHEPRAALGYVNAALAGGEVRADPLREAEARLLAADLYREQNDPARARQELSAALGAALRGRQPSGPRPALARAERVLARVLDRFGDEAGAARASSRALEAAQSDPDEMSAVLLEALARAYVARDLETARRVARKSLSAGLGDDAMVYVGIWLQSLERETRARTDGTAAEALGAVRPGPSWPGRLLAWAQGKLSDADLGRAARTPGQRLEAQFYAALARRAAGDAAGAEGALRAVAQSPSLDLMEAQIARDLLAGPARRVPGPPPLKAP